MTQTNILFILMDDMGWRDIAPYGSTFYETPNLDRLRREGMLFTDAYAACPVCSPTRASILSGQYPARVGLTNYIGGDEHPAHGKLIDTPYIRYLPHNITSVAETLRRSGYHTWHVGKWHLGTEEYYPKTHGFEENVGGCHYGCPPHGYFSPYRIDNLPDGPDGEFLTDRLTDEAIRLINEKQDDRPFYLNLNYYAVHHPIQAKAKHIDDFRQKAKRLGLDKENPFEVGECFPTHEQSGKRIVRRVVQSDPIYAAMIYSLDENIGRLLDTLDQTGMADDTLVIFTSDNGGLSTSEGSPTSNLPLSEGKGWMYEGGTREPMLARWPAVIPANSQCAVPVTSPDFYPTFAEIAGAPLPEGQIMDGVSILPLFNGANALDERALFWHYPHYGNQGGTPGASIRVGSLKLIHFFEDGHEELYDLAKDVSEQHNLIDTQPEIARDLHDRLFTWLREVEALTPCVNPDADDFPERVHHQTLAVSRYDLDTPLGVLLHDLEARGVVLDYIPPEVIENAQWIVGNHGRGLNTIRREMPLEEIAEQLARLEVQPQAKPEF